MATKANRYDGLDGLKAYAIIGIALMPVLANGEYGIGGFVFERLIPSFTNLVFLSSGLIFLYRKELAEFASKYKVIAGAILLIATVAYFALGGSTFTMLLFCVVALIYILGCRTGGLVNPVARFLGGICFEIYLCHMVIYRVLEKLHLVHQFGNGLLAYIFTAVAVSAVQLCSQYVPSGS